MTREIFTQPGQEEPGQRAEAWPAGAGKGIIRANARDANAERYD
jgi:hypothetical protein